MTKLDELVSNIKKEHVYIQTHNFPDPDAIASAYGLQRLLEIKGIKSTICYKGKIDRINLISMVEKLHIEARNVDEIEELCSEDEVILIDSQKGNGNTYDIIGDEVASIDHHPTFYEIDYRFMDVRPNVGACSSIIAEYFYENNIPMDKVTATALMYGLKIDTADMTRGVSELDLKVFHNLYFAADMALISYFSSNELQLNDLQAYSTAIESIEVIGCISFANTGNNCPEGLIATISDFVMSLEQVEFSVVYSYNNGGIKLSVRSSKYSGLNAGEIVMKALDGIGTGGGHFNMAGGFVPYSETIDLDDLVDTFKNKFIELVKERYELKV